MHELAHALNKTYFKPLLNYILVQPRSSLHVPIHPVTGHLIATFSKHFQRFFLMYDDFKL